MTEYRIRVYETEIDTKAILEGRFSERATPATTLFINAPTQTKLRAVLVDFIDKNPMKDVKMDVEDIRKDETVGTMKATQTAPGKHMFVWDGKQHGFVNADGTLDNELEKMLAPPKKFGVIFTSDAKDSKAYKKTVQAMDVMELRVKLIKSSAKDFAETFPKDARKIRFIVYSGRKAIAEMNVTKGGNAIWMTEGKRGTTAKRIDPRTGKLL